MQAAGPLFSHDKASVAGSAPAMFLPTTRAEMAALGWQQCDVIIVTGDAYVDHPSFGMAIIGAIVGEFLGAQKGLGLVIATAQNNFNPNGVFAAMFIIAVLALTAEGLIALLERRLLSWRPPSQTEAAAA